MTPSKSSDEVRCPRGHLTSGKFPFCTECGAELDPQGEDDAVLRCQNGHIVSGGHRFCIECGAPVDTGAQPAETVDEPEPTPLADTTENDGDVEEVRCPKGHLTPAEYPYCIICGAELEKGAAPAAPAAPAASRAARPKRAIRRRPRAAGVETPVADEPEPEPEPPTEPEPDEPPAALPDDTEDVAVPRTPARRPRVRRPVRRPIPEVEDDDDEDFLGGEEEDVPPIVTMDEPEAEDEDEPFLAPVPSYTDSDERDEAVEHFVHTPTLRMRGDKVARSGFDKQKWVIPVAAGALAVIAAVILVLILRNPGSSPTPTPVPTAFVTTAPASIAPTTRPESSAAPAGPNSNVAMRVASSSVGAGATTNTYAATATIRNPTDFAARNITVTFTLKDAAGTIIGTVDRSIASLPSGAQTTVSASGTDPSGKRPVSVEVRAVAAQVTS